MVTVKRYDFASKSVSDASFDESVFGDRTRLRCLRATSLMYAANRRQGTVNTLERSFVAGTTKKPWKQKHTGRARAGSKKSPIWRGGGTIFGPHPRDYGYHRPRRELQVALRGALFGKLRDGEVGLVANMKFDAPKSKDARAMFRAFGDNVGDTSSCLVVLGAANESAWRSMRNFPRVSVKTADHVNAQDVLEHRLVLLTDEATERLKSGARNVAVTSTSTQPAKPEAGAKPPAKRNGGGASRSRVSKKAKE